MMMMMMITVWSIFPIYYSWISQYVYFLCLFMCVLQVTEVSHALIDTHTLTCTHRHTLNKSWRQQPTKQQLYGHLPLRDKLISDVLLWTPSHGLAKTGQPARTYIQHPCADTGCILEDLLEAMDDREGWWEGQGNPCRERNMMMMMK